MVTCSTRFSLTIYSETASETDVSAMTMQQILAEAYIASPAEG
jgi:hypothetical protein